MESDVSPDTSVQSRKSSSNGDDVKDSKSGMQKMSRLNEKIEKLVIDLKFMHDENDNLKLELAKEKIALKEKHDAEIRLKEEMIQSEVEKTEAVILKKDEELRARDVQCALLIKKHEEEISKLQEELNKAHETISQKDDELSLEKKNKDISDGSCGCKQTEKHECDWASMQEKIDSQNEVIKDLERDRDDLVERTKSLTAESGDLSKQLETLRTKGEQDLTDKQKLLTKTESIVTKPKPCRMIGLLQPNMN